MNFFLNKFFLTFLIGVCLLTALLSAKDETKNSFGASKEHVTRAYRIPPGFVTQLIWGWYEGQGRASDPFEDNAETNPERAAVLPKPEFPGLMETMSMVGITFPKGGHVVYNPEKGKLEVRADIDTLELVEAYIDSWNNSAPKQVNIRAEIYQMPARAALKIQQLCGPMDDHTLIWRKVQTMVEKKQASLVTSVSTIARSGVYARVNAVNEVIYPTEIDWDKKEEKMIPVAFETRNVGTILSVDPFIDSDGFIVDLSLSLEHHTAHPGMRPISVTSVNGGRVVVTEMPEFHTKRIQTQLTLGINSSKCIGAWRPTGKPEYAKANVMQVVFLRVDMQTTGKIVPWREKE